MKNISRLEKRAIEALAIAPGAGTATVTQASVEKINEGPVYQCLSWKICCQEIYWSDISFGKKES